MTIEIAGNQVFKNAEILQRHRVIGLMSGQGELKPKMGLGLLINIGGDPFVSHVFETANDIFHRHNSDKTARLDFRDIIENGFLGQLSQTQIAQPLLVILNTLSRYVLEKQFGIHLSMLAGHSAGEYSALPGNCLNIDSALEAIIARGRITQEEVQRSIDLAEPQTTMYALKRKNPIDLDEVFASLHTIGISPPNASDQTSTIQAGYALINGKNDLVVWSEDQYSDLLKTTLKPLGIRMIKLNIPTAFHANTPTMLRIAKRMNGVLHSLNWKDAETPIIMNATQQVARSKDDIVQALLDNHTKMVDWLGCMKTMAREGVDAAVQLGPGSFLSQQIGQIIPGIITDYSGL